MKYGEIRWARLPDRGGHEQRGQRPIIVWQDTVTFAKLPTVIVIPLTTRLDASRFSGTVTIQPSAGNGLKSASVVLVFQLGACDIRRVAEKLGEVDGTDLARIRDLAARMQMIR